MHSDALPSIEQIDKELARRSFAEFIKQAWVHVEPSVDLLWNWHIDAIADHLQAVAEGKIKRLIINIPFRCSKSTLCSTLFPAWCWLNTPSKKIITTSYDEALALRDAWSMRALVNTDWYKSLFKDNKFQLADDQAQKRYFANTQGGHRLARGITSGATGHTAELLIADDPMNAKKATSEIERNTVIDSFQNQFMTRLSPPGQGGVVIVMQRLHHQDLSGIYLEDDTWDKLIIPMTWDGNQRSKTKLDWKDPRTEEGELMFPQYFTPEAIEGYKTNGSQFIASQLQQHPVAAEGSIIKNEWIREYKELPAVKKYSWSWDTAFKTGQKNDYSVGTLWAECEDGYYLVDMIRKKLEYTALKQLISSAYQEKPASEVVVEDKATGQSLVQDLKRFTQLPVIPVIPGRDMPGSKEERLEIVAGLFEAGKVLIPEKASWKLSFIQEITEFGYQPHDDIVDSVTQYLHRALSQKRKVRFTVV
jgi:predicted phage terminase large subunit-like protein